MWLQQRCGLTRGQTPRQTYGPPVFHLRALQPAVKFHNCTLTFQAAAALAPVGLVLMYGGLGWGGGGGATVTLGGGWWRVVVVVVGIMDANVEHLIY